jgi:BirA family biotin operon repressor/biotin-[acetyl-CoA-carboxylase] ligase
MDITILRFDSLPSTNTEAAEHARRGADEGLCVIAREQTSGRGRNGRAWISNKDSGLYFSIILRPEIESRWLPLITLMAGIAVFDMLSGIGIRPDIKWVNDVLVGDKKICGILAETVETARGTAVVVGIGINLTSTNFSNGIEMSATSILAESGRSFTADQIATELTPFFTYFYTMLCNDNDPGEIIAAWRDRSTYFKGKNVRVKIGGGQIEGVTDGLEANGALRIVTSDGSIKVIQAGDVEQLRPDQTKEN